MSSRPWLPHAAALRLKAKNLQANAVTLRIRLVASYGRVVCVVAPSRAGRRRLGVRFSPNGTTCGSHGR